MFVLNRIASLGAPTSRRRVGTVGRNAASRRDASTPKKEKIVDEFST
jgi:hypothetical protein